MILLVHLDKHFSYIHSQDGILVLLTTVYRITVTYMARVFAVKMGGNSFHTKPTPHYRLHYNGGRATFITHMCLHSCVPISAIQLLLLLNVLRYHMQDVWLVVPFYFRLIAQTSKPSLGQLHCCLKIIIGVGIKVMHYTVCLN